MSDAGRKDFTDKIHEAIKPEAQKPATEKIGESITNAADNIAGAVQPESEKGVFQKAHDDSKVTKENAKATHESWVDTAKKEGEVLLNSARNAVNHAAEYIAGSTADAKTAVPSHPTATDTTASTTTSTTAPPKY